jgi:hypothetical protein
MNRERIEQIDDPVLMYRRPRTRVCRQPRRRTDLLDGRRDGNRILFPISTCQVPFHLPMPCPARALRICGPPG